MQTYELQRFKDAQQTGSYESALSEIVAGRKHSHWIWYVFPQIQGLGRSHMARYYALQSLGEAEAYLHDAILGPRLRQITEALLLHAGTSADTILGSHIDAIKVRSCMTLFDILSPNDIFSRVLDTFYDGKRCGRTLSMCAKV
jgi:uncharacterized protein (DUF1810 family)